MPKHRDFKKKMKAFIVLGPENSGTRFLTNILIKAGCLGQDTHEQDFDELVPRANGKHLVWRRSVPHGDSWVDLDKIIYQARYANFAPFIIVNMREWHSLINSQANNFAFDKDVALNRIRAATLHIFDSIDKLKNVPFIVVTYESIVYNPASINRLLEFIGLNRIDNFDFIYDGNVKHYQHESASRGC